MDSLRPPCRGRCRQRRPTVERARQVGGVPPQELAQCQHTGARSHSGCGAIEMSPHTKKTPQQIRSSAPPSGRYLSPNPPSVPKDSSFDQTNQTIDLSLPGPVCRERHRGDAAAGRLRRRRGRRTHRGFVMAGLQASGDLHPLARPRKKTRHHPCRPDRTRRNCRRGEDRSRNITRPIGGPRQTKVGRRCAFTVSISVRQSA